jgi:hypothetical protein
LSDGYQMTSVLRKYRPPAPPMMMHLHKDGTGELIIPVRPIPFPDFTLGTPCRVRYWFDEAALLHGDDYHAGPEIGLWYPARFFLRMRGDSSRGVFILYRRDAEPFPFMCDLSPEWVDPRPSARRWTGPVPPWAQPRLF